MPRAKAAALNLTVGSTGQTLGERVYGSLRLALQHGQLAPGQVLTIRALAAALKTSRMPVREALLRLGAEGALEVLSNGSVRMPILSSARYRELTQSRILIEGEVAAQAAQIASAKDIRALRALEKCYETSVRAGRIEEVLAANYDLHFHVYRLSGNDTLLHLIEQLWMQAGPYVARTLALVRLLSPQDQEHRPFNPHRDLLSALGDRNSEAARLAIKSDIGVGFKLFESFATRIDGVFPSIFGTDLYARAESIGVRSRARKSK